MIEQLLVSSPLLVLGLCLPCRPGAREAKPQGDMGQETRAKATTKMPGPCLRAKVTEVKASACNVGDMGSIPESGRSPGEGNGNPLQYSCLENPMDGGAWWATVHGVAKSRT